MSPAHHPNRTPGDGMASAPEEHLASFVSRLRLEQIPPAVIDRVKDLLLDAIASAFVGRGTEQTPSMEAVARVFGGRGESTVIGGASMSLAGATLVNGYQITAATVCDVHRPILCHVTPVVVPPVLAVAELDGASGADVLVALAAGLETTVRVGLALVYERFRARGWHAPGVVGPFGGAAGVARLRGFDQAKTGHALGFAGSQSAGTFAGLGSSQVKFHQARGAVSGLLAALIAGEGLDSSSRILTAPDGGLLTTHSDGGDPARLVEGIGSTWELMGISLRRWPTASALQAVVQASLELIREHHPDLADASVRIGLPEGSYRLNGGTEWRDQLGAFQSAAYVAAVTLRDGQCQIEQFSPAHVADPSLREFVRARVLVDVDESLPGSGATVTVDVPGRPAASARVDVPGGDPSVPLTRGEIASKLGAATAGTVFGGRTPRIVDIVSELERAASIEPLIAAVRAPDRQG